MHALSPRVDLTEFFEPVARAGARILRHWRRGGAA